jgi:replicative DNA helicase
MSNDTIDTSSLPFSLEKQRAVLGHALYDERFFSTIIARVDAEWFSEPLVCRIYDALKKWYLRWQRQPTINEVLDSEWITKLRPEEIQQIQGIVAMVKKSRETHTPIPLLAEMEVWLKARLLQLALPKAAAAFNLRKIDESVVLLNTMVKEFHEIRFMEDGESKFDKFRDELVKEQVEKKHAMTFGLTPMDRLLDPYGNSGSLLPGDMTVVLAPTNVGKTSVMVTIACHNIAQGKSVLFVSHEGRPDEIKNKFMRCLTRMTPPELLRAYLDPKMSETLKAYEEMFNRFLVYVPMNKPGQTVEEVAMLIERYQDRRRLATGRGFDMLIDDYPAKLSTTTASKGNLQLRHIQEIVYNQFVQMGLTHNFHVLVAIQTNREGSKVNRKMGAFKNETRLLHMEDVMETWGKSRSGETGWAVVVNTDFNRCLIHANDLGCFWYRGEDGLGDKSADIMNAFKGQAVPSEKIRWYEELGTG